VSTRGKFATEEFAVENGFQHSGDVTDVTELPLHHEHLNAMEVCSLQDLYMWALVLPGNAKDH